VSGQENFFPHVNVIFPASDMTFSIAFIRGEIAENQNCRICQHFSRLTAPKCDPSQKHFQIGTRLA
jgi:hypothetical protein